MNVLSLFDGMSCGQQALNRAGFKIDKYFASEIDKHAIVVTMANYPETVQLGSVVNVNGYDLPKIDLLIGGSPCQSFSFAGKRKGMTTKDEQQILTLEHYLELKNDGFEFEGQSYLFWEYMRLLTEIRTKNPNVFFLLENVLMSENWERVLSGAIGVHPIEINSALVCAQNRRRLYWTNIGLQPAGLFGDMESIIQLPKDKGILLKDILQDNQNAKYYLSEKAIAKVQRYNNKQRQLDDSGKSMCLMASYFHQGRDNQFVCEPISEKYYLTEKMLEFYKSNHEKMKLNGNGFTFQPTEGEKKSNTITTKEASRMDDNFIICHSGQKRSENRPSILKNKNAGGTGPLSRTDGKTYCLDHTSFANYIEKRKVIATQLEQSENFGNATNDRGKAFTLRSSEPNGIIIEQAEVISMDFRHDEGFRIRENGKSPTLTITSDNNGMSGKPLIAFNKRIRRLTPVECERLQTVPDNYTNHVSDTQRYRMLGNGWTVDVIAHIFKYLPNTLKK